MALAETDLTVETLGRDELDRTLAEISRRVPTGTSSQPFQVDRDDAPGTTSWRSSATRRDAST